MTALNQEFMAALDPTPTVDRIPDGWYTTRQVAVDKGMSRVQASRLIRDAVEAGTLTVRQFRIKTGSMTRLVPHYRAVAVGV